MTMPSAAKFEQVGPKKTGGVQNLSGKQRPIRAANLERPAEVRFSPSLQAKGFFASGLR
jgi:hypothetical protein